MAPYKFQIEKCKKSGWSKFQRAALLYLLPIVFFFNFWGYTIKFYWLNEAKIENDVKKIIFRKRNLNIKKYNYRYIA